MSAATILIITANDTQAQLPSLSAESKEIQRILNSMPGRDFETLLVPDTSIKDIIEEFKIPNRTIEVIHYAGHADQQTLRFTDKAANAKELAEKIRNQGTVKFVFLNGCATSGQVKFFHEAGVPFVMATTRNIADQKAKWVSTQFYQYLTLKHSLKKAILEVTTDSRNLGQQIPFINERGVVSRKNLPTEKEVLPWGLYIKEEMATLDYAPPVKIQQTEQSAKVVHTRFLDKLIFALEKSPDKNLSAIRKLAANIKRSGSITDENKTIALLKVLPYTLGLRLRQIVSEPEELSTDYYRQLLFDYVFFFETLLHHTLSLLLAQLWEDKAEIFNYKPKNASKIWHFLQEDRLQSHAITYHSIIQLLVEWVENYRGKATTKIYHQSLDYLQSEDFKSAADFFFLQKKYYWQRIRMASEEAIENCIKAQQHLTTAFPYFKFILKFRMASVRGINVINFRHLPSDFESIENIVSKLIVNEHEQAPIIGKAMLDNRSILSFFDSDPDIDATSLNLFPFIIDRNVFAKMPNDEIDLYLLTGYFSSSEKQQPCYHYVSISHPWKIWQFKDPNTEEVSFLHLGEEARLEHAYNHLMASPWELKNYLDQYDEQFLQHIQD